MPGIVPRLYRDPHAPPVPDGYVVARAVGSHEGLIGGDEAAWAPAGVITWGHPSYLTGFRALWGARGLYVRFVSMDPSPWHTMTRHDDPLWEEEVVEVFLDPAGSSSSYYELEISPANIVCELRIARPWPELQGDRAWDCAGLETVVRRIGLEPGGQPGWTATACLPWDGLAALSDEAAVRVPPRSGDRWRFNVFRIKRPHGPAEPERDAIYAAWSVPDGPSFHAPAAFRDLVFW